jgi:hypothetical protein
METLIDIIIVNNTNEEKHTATLNVGYSDHLAQALYIKMKKLPKGPVAKCNRHFIDNNMAEFKYLLHKETWDEVLELPEEPNTAVNLFMSTFSYYFNIAFPLKVMSMKNSCVAVRKSRPNVTIVPFCPEWGFLLQAGWPISVSFLGSGIGLPAHKNFVSDGEMFFTVHTTVIQ